LSRHRTKLIEEFVPGTEVTIGILHGRPLPIIEVRTQDGFYDYHAKYFDEKTEYLFDTITDTVVAANVSRTAVECFDSLGCRHLEANTIPGFTSHSLLPKAAAKAGLSMSDLCTEIVEAAYSTLVRRNL